MRALVSVVALASVALAAHAADRGDAFALAMLRRDGVAIPFATFDGGSWSAHWPEPSLELTVPVSVDSVPKGWWGPTGPIGTWQAWLAHGEPQTLRVQQPDWIGSHCVRQVGLRTDYRPTELPPPPAEQPYPKDGLLVWPAHSVERVDVVPKDGPDGRGVAAELLAAFNRAEDKLDHRYLHPVAASNRHGIAPTVEAMYGYGDEPRVFYVESVREYNTAGPEECVAAFGTGWFVRETGRFRSLDMAVDLLGCNRQGASYMLPLGVIRTGTRLFWAVQFSGFDHERYVVIEPREKRVDAVLSVWGGGC